ncbi:MAG: hydroxysqualene dehydroxylase HpnE [Pseudomonadota bacterium]
MTGHVHIIGAGLAGLSSAVRLVERGVPVTIYEAAPFAGGRCRTFHDPRLGRDVDNGNHLMLSGNTSAAAYLDLIGARAKMRMAPAAAFDFFDVADGDRWRVAMNDGPVPWWVTRRTSRIPGTRLMDYVKGIGLALAAKGSTVAEAVRDRGPLWTRFWEPLTLAVLNTTPERGSAPLLWRAMSETFAKGGAKSRPMFAPDGLGRALVDPAVDHLRAAGAQIHFGHALKGVTNAADRLTDLHFTNGHAFPVAANDRVILALPPTRLKAALPWIEVPQDNAAILNAHFVVNDPAELETVAPVTGLINTTTHWAFVRGDVVSLTVSAADRLGVMDKAPDDLIPLLWAETAQALNLSGGYKTARVNKERRATIDQSPAEAAKRPSARTPLENLVLAGDATDTGLPATIEGAIRSGETAAQLAA